MVITIHIRSLQVPNHPLSVLPPAFSWRADIWDLPDLQINRTMTGRVVMDVGASNWLGAVVIALFARAGSRALSDKLSSSCMRVVQTVETGIKNEGK